MYVNIYFPANYVTELEQAVVVCFMRSFVSFEMLASFGLNLQVLKEK